MECDPQEHVTLWNCSHGVRINEPVCMECLLEEKEASDLPGWPLIPTFRSNTWWIGSWDGGSQRISIRTPASALPNYTEKEYRG